MRELLVEVLLEHGLPDHARRMAVAPASVAGAPFGPFDRSGSRSRAKLARLAAAALDGRPPASVPRARPVDAAAAAEVRYLAHRADTADVLATALRELHAAAEPRFLVVAVEGREAYVQATNHPGPGLRMEAVGDAHLSAERRPDAAAIDRIRALGWRPGDAATDGNWTQDAAVSTGAGWRAAAAGRLLATLEQGFGCAPGDRFVVTRGDWSA